MNVFSTDDEGGVLHARNRGQKSRGSLIKVSRKGFHETQNERGKPRQQKRDKTKTKKKQCDSALERQQWDDS